MSAQAGWYVVNGQQHYWDGYQWAPAAVPAYIVAAPRPRQRFSAGTVLGFVLALLSGCFFLLPPVAALLGLIALVVSVVATGTATCGRGLAIAGIVLSSLTLLVTTLTLIL